ncbi:SRPBCC family protein [Haloarchaeobius sp. TZWWS8]|uniref:SRPBCC family protein n=1 Tax=Haloarchaeobius sp. TZWWS8 TaxID=3446121 RepID=UPI003EBD115C
MAEVSVSRRLAASRPTVARELDPRTIVELEGTFEVADVTETDDGWLVEATAPGMRAEFAVREFEEGDRSGYVYEQVGERGPFAAMRTRLSLEPASDGTTVTAESTVDLGLPAKVVTDRIAGWKRRGELRRVLDGLESAVA